MKSVSPEKRRRIFERTNGKCHLCGKSHDFEEYGAGGTWEIDHSVPKAKGGTDRVNNLNVCCISCNRRKQAMTTRAARARHGRTRAPPSTKVVRSRWAVAGLVALGVVVWLGSGGRIAKFPRL